MKQYSVNIQVDFDKPRVMPPCKGSKRPWNAIGYIRNFYCSDGSKDKAKQMAFDFVNANETFPEACRFKCVHIAWMHGLTSRDQIPGGLTQAMFEKRHDHGIWYDSGKQYYVSDADCAAAWTEEDS
jgi:hypothetical protein